MLSAGFYLLNDKDISYESSLTPGQELKGAKERGVMVLDYLALEKWKASIYYGGRTDREDFGGRIMNKNAGLGMGYMRNGNENWYMLSAGYDTKRVTGRSYFEQNNDLKEFGVLSSVNLGNTDNFKDISLDVYANTRFDSANPLKFGSDSELEQGVVSILNQYNDLEKTFGEIRNIKGDKEAEAFYQDNMLSITRNLIELMDDFNLDDNMYNSNAMAGFRINWYDQNGDYQTIKFTTTMTSVNDKNQLWAMVEYSMLRDKETLIQKLVPNTVMLAVPEKTNIDENESSKGMFGARWDFDKTVFSVVGFADKDSNVGLVGGASMKFPNAKENKYLGLQLGSSGTYYTMRAAYGGKNFAIATEFDKNIAGSKDLLLGIGASRFDRGLIFNLSAAFVQANYEKIPNIPATVDDLEVKYNNVMKAIKTNLSVSYPFVVYGTRTTLQGYLERLDVMKPLPTSEYEFGLKLGLGF